MTQLLNQEKGRNEINYIHFLRSVSTFAVIVLHVAAPIVNNFIPGKVGYDWWVGNFIDSITRFCVPVFLMITGVLVFNSNDSPIIFYKKRISRIVYPFVLWSFLYILYSLYYSSNNFSISTFKVVFSLFIAGNPTSFHLWYLYMLIGLYFFLPFLKPWIQTATKKEILIFLGFWIVALIVELPFIKKFNIGINFAHFYGYLGYPILGYYLNKYAKDLKKK